jgi:hypothetical protein
MKTGYIATFLIAVGALLIALTMVYGCLALEEVVDHALTQTAPGAVIDPIATGIIGPGVTALTAGTGGVGLAVLLAVRALLRRRRARGDDHDGDASE